MTHYLQPNKNHIQYWQSKIVFGGIGAWLNFVFSFIIALKYGECPQIIIEGATPEYAPKFNCSAKTAEVLWQKIENNPELHGSADKYEIIRAQ